MRPQNKADEFNPAFILGQVWANAQHVARQAFRRSTRQFASPQSASPLLAPFFAEPKRKRLRVWPSCAYEDVQAVDQIA